MDMTAFFRDRLVSGLTKKSITKPLEWAQNYRVMGGEEPGKFSVKLRPWLGEMHNSVAPKNVGQKSAQMGYTETMMNVAFYRIDIRRSDVLYILPNKNPDSSDFSASRFNPALELSDYIRNMFTEVNNVGHKRAGANNLYIRGSQSRAGLKSIPAGTIIFDEFEEINKDNVQLAYERASGQSDKLIWEISTPFVDGAGINLEYTGSTQEEFMFPCPGCNRIIKFDFPGNIEIVGSDQYDIRLHESYYKCDKCGRRIEEAEKAECMARGSWVAKFADRIQDCRGFWVSQMYSTKISAAEIARSYFRGLSDTTAEQEFWNSKMGRPYTVKGAQITDDDLIRCKSGYSMILNPGAYKLGDKLITMGVDVGRRFHCVLIEWEAGDRSHDVNSSSVGRVIYACSVTDIEEVKRVYRDYSVKFGIIDANPERRASLNFVDSFAGSAYMCFYSRGVDGRRIVPTISQEMAVSVDRTSWLDMYLGRYVRSTIQIPMDISGEFLEHHKSLVRGYTRDSTGNPVGRYVQIANRADHYAHAGNYAEIALSLALSGGQTERITKIV